jgi:hypothetical protein
MKEQRQRRQAWFFNVKVVGWRRGQLCTKGELWGSPFCVLGSVKASIIAGKSAFRGGICSIFIGQGAWKTSGKMGNQWNRKHLLRII